MGFIKAIWGRMSGGRSVAPPVAPPSADERVFREPCGCRLVCDSDATFMAGEFRGCDGAGPGHHEQVYDGLLNQALAAAFFGG